MTGQSILRLAPIAAFLLGGCGGDYSHLMDHALVVPGYADTRPCSEVIGLVAGYKQQVKQLTELVVKAQSDAGGTFISAIAYNTDLAKAQARLRDAEQASARMHCDPNEKATAPPPETTQPQPGFRPTR
jgi:hypothetical protein